jgi:CelD/BcsL family acetyltransferase involved in cellulose biosynthesis
MGLAASLHTVDEKLRPPHWVPRLQFSVVTESGSLHSLQVSWRALCISAGAQHLFQSFDWCWNAWISAERHGHRLRVVLGYSGSDLALIWPLMTDNRVIRLLSADILEYRDAIVARSEFADGWVNQAWSYLVTSRQADWFIFQNLRHPNVLGKQLATLPLTFGIGGGWCPIIRLDQYPSWEAYAATRSKSIIRDQHRQWRRLRQALPNISFRVLETSGSIDAVHEWIADHKRSWGKARGLRLVWTDRADIRNLIVATARTFADSGRFVLATLEDDNTRISAGWGYVCGNEFLFHAFAYDVAFENYSPSRLFLESLVRWCIDQGIEKFDFMPGKEAYKRIWATDYIQTVSYVGALSRRGEILLNMLQRKNVRRGMSFAIRGVNRLLWGRPGRVVQQKMRQFQVLINALNLEAAPERPLCGK